MRHPISERGATATGHRSRSSTRLRAPRLPLAIWRASCAPVVRAGSSGTRVCATCGTRTRANGRGQLARTQIRIRHGISSTGPFLASQFSFSANPPEEQPGDQSVKRADILPTVSLVCRAQSAVGLVYTLQDACWRLRAPVPWSRKRKGLQQRRTAPVAVAWALSPGTNSPRGRQFFFDVRRPPPCIYQMQIPHQPAHQPPATSHQPPAVPPAASGFFPSFFLARLWALLGKG
jgi:hypothetical protein